MAGALDGIIVADFSRVLAGPLCTMHLADMGATVIKVERPDGGDDTRHWPPYLDDGTSTYYASINRNKQSVALDLTDAADLAMAKRLAERADVMIENFRPGMLEAFGLGYEAVSPSNPGLIYCSISGFGTTGEGADMPGFDFLVQGMGGLMSLTGPADGEPYRVGVAMVDVLAGLHALAGILAALHARDRNDGLGQKVEVALMSSLLAGMVNASTASLLAGDPVRAGNRHASVAPYEVFHAADGPFILATGNDRQYQRVCEVIGAPEMADDPRFVTNHDRVNNIASCAEMINEKLSAKKAREWIALFLDARVPAGPINTLSEAFADAERLGLEPVIEVDGMRLPRAPFSFSGTPVVVNSRPPSLGENSAEIRRWLESEA